MVQLAHQHNIRMIFVLSPYFKDNPSKALDAARKIAVENHLDFMDCYNEPEMMRRELFRDVMHLNDEGARVWSAFLAHILKEKLAL